MVPVFQFQGNLVLSCDTFSRNADPVQVSGELFRDVGLPSRRESHHHDHGRGVGELGHRCWNTQTHRQTVKTPVNSWRGVDFHGGLCRRSKLMESG